MMDGGGKLTINNQSLAIDTASEAGFNVQEAATVSVKNSGDFSVTNVLRGIGLQTRNAGTSPQMTVESENIGIDASVAKGGAVYLLAYHVPGTHTDLSLTARETVHLNGDSYGTYTYGNNTLDIAGKNVDIGGNKYGMYAAGTDAMHDNTVTVTANDTLAVNGRFRRPVQQTGQSVPSRKKREHHGLQRARYMERTKGFGDVLSNDCQGG